MACQTLLRRRAQLALLASACEQGVPACVGFRRKSTTTREVRLVALERDGVLVAWLDDPIPGAELPGQPIEVRFDHKGEHYVFFAVTRGRVRRDPEGHETRWLLKLSLPLRLERAQRRQHVRLPLENLPAITGTFTHVVDDRRQFQARLTDIADGGVAVTVRAADVSELRTGDLFWVDMELPGEQVRWEFVVRLVHLRPIKSTDRLAMGWAFQPSDDAGSYETYLRRLEAIIARQQRPGSDEGTS
ncbi:MAG: PilZ domain-containing protein [Phycisphaerae bacterium]